MYVVFATKEILDPRSWTIMGLSAKPNSDSPIGKFGSGLKYAIATCVRQDIPITIRTGNDTFTFTKKQGTFRDAEYFQVVQNKPVKGFFNILGTPFIEMPYTTQFGHGWALWQTFRELESNTRDESGISNVVNGEPAGCSGEEALEGYINSLRWKGYQTFIVVQGQKFYDEYLKRDEVFLPKSRCHTALHGERPPVHIWGEQSNAIFYRGLKVYELPKPSLFTYDLQTYTILTEDRTLAYYPGTTREIRDALMSSNNPDLIRQLLLATSKTGNNSEVWEADLAFDGASVATASAAFTGMIRTLKKSKQPLNTRVSNYYSSWGSSQRASSDYQKAKLDKQRLRDEFRKAMEEMEILVDDIREGRSEIDQALLDVAGEAVIKHKANIATHDNKQNDDGIPF